MTAVAVIGLEIEPSLGVDLNVATWLRIGVAGSYMLPVDAELGPFSASDLGGPGGQLVLKFGKF